MAIEIGESTGFVARAFLNLARLESWKFHHGKAPKMSSSNPQHRSESSLPRKSVRREKARHRDHRDVQPSIEPLEKRVVLTDHFVFSGLASGAAGSSEVVTIEALNSADYPDTLFAGDVTFSSSDPSLQGIVGDQSFSNFEETFTITFETAGTQTITATDPGTATTSSSPVVITASSFAKFGFIGLQNAAAGTTQTYTVEAEDTYGNEVSSFAPTRVELTSSDPNSTGSQLGMKTFTSSAETFSIAFNTPGTQSITAAHLQVPYATNSSTPVTITAGGLDHFAFIGLSNETAGTPQAFTVEAEDAFGSELSSFSGIVDFSSSDPQIQYLPTSATFNNGSTILTVAFETAGTQTINATDGSVTSSSSATITAGSFAKFGFIGLQNAAAGIEQTVTIQAEDAYGNTISSSVYGNVVFSSSDPHLAGFPNLIAFPDGERVFTITFETAGTQTISATNLTVASSSSPVTISPGAFDKFAFLGLQSTVAGADQSFTVEAEDAYGNEVSSFNDHVSLSSSDPRASILPQTFATFTSPAETFSIDFKTAGSQSITAIDLDQPTLSTSSTPVSITAGSFDKFGFLGLQSTAAGADQSLTVEAQDAYGNEVSSFNNLVSLSSSDSQATGLPSGFTTFTSPAETFSIAFKTAGTQSITAADGNVTVFNSSTPVTITAGTLDHFAFLGLGDGTAGTPQTITVESEDAYGNTLSSSVYGSVEFSSSDPNLAGFPHLSGFPNGSGTFTITFETAGTQTINAFDPAIPFSTSSNAVTITAGTFDKFGFIGLQGGAAGATQSFIAEAEDAYGNAVSSFSGTVNFSSSDPNIQNLPPNQSFGGAFETLTIEFETAGLQTIKAIDASVTSSSTPVTITAGTFAQFGFIGLQSTAAGTTQSFIAEAEDAYGNAVSNFSGTVNFSSSDPNIQYLPPNQSFGGAFETLTIEFETAGLQTIKAIDASVTSSSTPVTITAGSFEKFGFIGLQNTAAGIEQTLTVEAEDAYGNEVSNYEGTVSYSSSDPSATGLPGFPVGFFGGQETLSITFKTAGTQSIYVSDGSVTSSGAATITAGSFAQFGFIGLQSTAAGITQTFTVEAQDAYGNEVSSFDDPVYLTSSDPQATMLPTTFYPISSPAETLSIAFETAGMQSITATDLNDSVSTSSSPVSITAGSFAQFGFIGLQSTAAGIEQSFTVEAEDAYGNEVSNYEGTVSYSSSDPSATGLPGFPVGFFGGQETLSITFRTAGTQSIYVSDGSVTSSGAATITAGSFAQFGFIGLQSTAAGIEQTFTVEAEDAYGNEVSSYEGTVSYSSSDPSATGLPGTPEPFIGGQETLSITFKTAGTQSIYVSDGTVTSSGAATITAGTFAEFGFVGLGNSTAGAAQTITIEAQDAYGNEVTSFNRDVDLLSTDPHLSGLPLDATFSSPSEIFTITFETAGTQTLYASSTIISTSSPVEVSPGAFAQFGFIGLEDAVAGTMQTFTVEAEDAYGNELSSFNGYVAFNSSDSQATGLPGYATSFTSPAETFSVAFETAGPQTIQAVDGSPLVISSSTPVTISPAAVDQFAFVELGGGTAGTSHAFEVAAEDAYGNVVSSFNGTVDFSSSDPQATGLPATATFTSPTEDFSITFKTAGEQTITATDGTVTSESIPVSITPASFDQFGFIGLEDAVAGTMQTFTVEAEDAYGNELSSFNGYVAFNSSDSQATGLPGYATSFTSPAETFSIAFETAGPQTIQAVDGSPLVISNSTPVTISSAAVDQFAFVELGGGIAGTSDDFEVAAEDAYGNLVSSFNGTVIFDTSDPQATSLPVSATFTSATEDFSINFKTAGEQTITATDADAEVSNSSSPVSITAASFAQFGFIGLKSDAAGTPQSFTLRAEDAYGNEVPSFSGTVEFSNTDSHATGLAPFSTVTSPQETFTVTFETAGTQTLSATDQTVTSSASPVTITPAAFDKFAFIGLDEDAAGTPQTFTVEAEDAYGNEVSSFSGTVALFSSDPHETGLPAKTTFIYPSFIFSITFETAGTQTISADSSTISSSAEPVTITAGALDQFGFIGIADGTAGVPDTVTVKAEDVYGNVITNYLGNISFSSTDPHAVLPTVYTYQADDNGVHVFNNGVTLKTVGSQTVTVTSIGTPATSDTATANIVPAGASSFSLTSSSTPGLAQTVNVTAYDAYGNVATGYNGTLAFTTSDPNAILPTTTTMTAGEGSFAFTFSAAGSFSISASDTANAEINGSTPVTIYKQTTQSAILSSSQAQVFYGQNVTLTATFTAPAVGNVPLTGTVAFYNGTTYLGTGTLVPGDPPATVTGEATITVPLLTPGSYTINAVYSGNANYASATSQAPLTVSVAQATTSTTLASTTTTQGTVLTANVVATSPGNPPLVGNVSFYDGGTLLGVAPAVNGVATLNIGVPSSSSHDFTATFSGDGTASTSGTTLNVFTDGPQIVGLSRQGFTQYSTVIVLTFNQPLNAATAQNPANFALLGKNGHKYALASVHYDPATLTVSIVPWSRLPILGSYKLEVIGTGANAVTNTGGLALDGTGSGKPGSNFVTQVTWRSLAAPKSVPAVTYKNGEATFTYYGRFLPYYHAVKVASQSIRQTSLSQSGPRTLVAASVENVSHVSKGSRVVSKAVKAKLVTTRVELPKVSRHARGHR